MLVWSVAGFQCQLVQVALDWGWCRSCPMSQNKSHQKLCQLQAALGTTQKPNWCNSKFTGQSAFQFRLQHRAVLKAKTFPLNEAKLIGLRRYDLVRIYMQSQNFVVREYHLFKACL